MIFEDLPRTPTSEELLDKAFSRAARAGRAKGGTQGQLSMLQTAGNILSDNLGNIATEWPDFDSVDPFYSELAKTLVDVDAVRASLAETTWASQKCRELLEEYRGRIRRSSPDRARQHRKQAFARMADVVEEIADDLERLGAARDELRKLPDIDPEEPTIVVAGYPNVGKTSFVNAVTRARNRTASYPFTTTGILVGHLERDHIRYQLVDTPGLLDRPLADRNEIERQAISAITHVADCVLVMIDPSETCGYPLTDQLALRDALGREFGDTPILTVCNKTDLFEECPGDFAMSVEDGTGVTGLVDATVDAIAYEPELPFER